MFKWLRSWKNIAMNQWTDNFIASPQNQQIKWVGVMFDFNQIWFGRRYFFYSESYLSFPCEQILSWKEGGGVTMQWCLRNNSSMSELLLNK